MRWLTRLGAAAALAALLGVALLCLPAHAPAGALPATVVTTVEHVPHGETEHEDADHGEHVHACPSEQAARPATPDLPGPGDGTVATLAVSPRPVGASVVAPSPRPAALRPPSGVLCVLRV